MGKWASGPRKFWGFQRKKTKERKVWENTCSPRMMIEITGWLPSDWCHKIKGGGVCHCHSRLISSKASRKYDNSSYRLGHWFHHWFHHHRHNQQRCIDLSMTSKKKKKNEEKFGHCPWELNKKQEKKKKSYLFHTYITKKYQVKVHWQININQ